MSSNAAAGNGDVAASEPSPAPVEFQAYTGIESELDGFNEQRNGIYNADFIANNSSVSHNASSAASHVHSENGSSTPQLAPSAQEIIKRVSAATNVSAQSPEWVAAREQVLKNMASSSAASSFLPARGRGRGRPRSSFQGTQSRGHVVPDGVTADYSLRTPIRGRGRGGRPRGKRSGRGRSKTGKRKRDDDSESSVSSDEEKGNGSESHLSTPTITKSGRNVTKPSQFNPAPEVSPTTGTRRRRTNSRKEPDQILCTKCLRGHSPLSNAIVLCDGCNLAYHQWCHDPLISRDVVEIVDKSWFCGRCLHAREIKLLPLEKRVGGGDLTTEEKSSYLSSLPAETLVSLLLHAASIYPDLPIFASNTRALIQSRSNSIPSTNLSKANSTAPTPLAPQHQSSLPQQMFTSQRSIAPNTTTNPVRQTTSTHQPATPDVNGNTHDDERDTEAEIEVEDPYPDYSNPAADPPATYPRPGHGPIKVRPTTDPEDMPWLIDDNFSVFSHFVADGNGNLVPFERTKDTKGPGSILVQKPTNGVQLQTSPQMQHLQNGNHRRHDHSLPIAAPVHIQTSHPETAQPQAKLGLLQATGVQAPPNGGYANQSQFMSMGLDESTIVVDPFRGTSRQVHPENVWNS